MAIREVKPVKQDVRSITPSVKLAASIAVQQTIRQVITQPNIHWLTVFLPISFAIAYIHWFKNKVLLFFTACLGMIVVAFWLGNATEQLATRVGAILGGMLNAAFSLTFWSKCLSPFTFSR
jgi:Ca2+:H+ antiporter